MLHLLRNSIVLAAATVAAVPISFRTHHPQGMVKIGDRLIVSSVEIRVPTKRLPQIVDGHDRDAGEGVGHLFKIDMAGSLIADLRLGKGAIYHPGAIVYNNDHTLHGVSLGSRRF